MAMSRVNKIYQQLVVDHFLKNDFENITQEDIWENFEFYEESLGATKLEQLFNEALQKSNVTDKPAPGLLDVLAYKILTNATTKEISTFCRTSKVMYSSCDALVDKIGKARHGSAWTATMETVQPLEKISKLAFLDMLEPLLTGKHDQRWLHGMFNNVARRVAGEVSQIVDNRRFMTRVFISSKQLLIRIANRERKLVMHVVLFAPNFLGKPTTDRYPWAAPKILLFDTDYSFEVSRIDQYPHYKLADTVQGAFDNYKRPREQDPAYFSENDFKYFQQKLTLYKPIQCATERVSQ